MSLCSYPRDFVSAEYGKSVTSSPVLVRLQRARKDFVKKKYSLKEFQSSGTSALYQEGSGSDGAAQYK